MKEAYVMAQDGNERGGTAVVAPAVEGTAELQIDVRLDIALFLCQACLLPLKPPIFKCGAAAGHVVCCYCRGGHGVVCSRADTHCGELDAIVSTAKVLCPYREFGCERYVVCKLSMERPEEDKDKRVLTSTTVGSSALTGAGPGDDLGGA